jgi:hypothetical protein
MVSRSWRLLDMVYVHGGLEHVHWQSTCDGHFAELLGHFICRLEMCPVKPGQLLSDAHTAVLVAGHNVNVHTAVAERVDIDLVDEAHIVNLASKLANITCKMIFEPKNEDT